MIVDTYTAKELDYSLFPSLPLPSFPYTKKWRAEDLTLLLLHNPPVEAPSTFVSWSLLALKEDKVIYVISLEKDDIRGLSDLLGVSVKELQKEYGTKSFYGKSKVVMYGNNEREEWEEYSGDEREETVEEKLMETLLDALDIPIDPIKVD